jgi:hypothetical protein
MANYAGTIVCSHCRCSQVRFSHRRWYEYPLGLLHIMPFRCMACERRFYRVSKLPR